MSVTSFLWVGNTGSGNQKIIFELMHQSRLREFMKFNLFIIIRKLKMVFNG